MRLVVWLVLLMLSRFFFCSCSQTVPKEMIVLWKRLILEEPKGKVVDNTSRVFDLQTDSMYGDLRIPLSRDSFPDIFKKDSLSQYTEEELMQLALQKSFAGYSFTEAKNGILICHWNHLIDYQPPDGSEDVGSLNFTIQYPYLIEEGIGEDDYRETWQPQEKTNTENYVSLELIKEVVQGKVVPSTKGFMVINNHSFIYSINHRSFDLPQADSLVQLFQKENYTRQEIEMILGSYVTCLGTTVDWIVSLSTFPFLQNKKLEGEFFFNDRAPSSVYQIGDNYIRSWAVRSMTFNPFGTESKGLN